MSRERCIHELINPLKVTFQVKTCENSFATFLLGLIHFCYFIRKWLLDGCLLWNKSKSGTCLRVIVSSFCVSKGKSRKEKSNTFHPENYLASHLISFLWKNKESYNNLLLFWKKKPSSSQSTLRSNTWWWNRQEKKRGNEWQFEIQFPLSLWVKDIEREEEAQHKQRQEDYSH